MLQQQREMLKKPVEILGIGTPIVDHVIRIDDEFIAKLPALKGDSVPVEHQVLIDLLEPYQGQDVAVIGGSAVNTIKGLARLGRSCAFFGKAGEDRAGKWFCEEMKRLEILSHLIFTKLPTAQVACFISPDSERTMCSFLGAGMDMRAEELTQELFHGVKIVHIEGYLLTRGSLVRRAMELAKEAGAKISFDISSVGMVREYRADLKDLIASYVDIVFANEEEALALVDAAGAKGCLKLKNMCEVAVVKMGSQGNWAASRGMLIHEPALKVSAVDTTGAGDLFSSGFLYGYLSNFNFSQCSAFGAKLASEAVQVLGANVPSHRWEAILKSL